MKDNRIEVMIADDHTLFREGIALLLQTTEDMVVSSQASDGDDCIEKLRYLKPDVLLLDIDMPKRDGLEVLENIRNRGWDFRVIILTHHEGIEYLMRAVDLGVNGYLVKDASLSEITDAIRCVLRDEMYIQEKLVPLYEARVLSIGRDQEKINSLTNREAEVLKQLALGFSNMDLAEYFCISEHTVKNHITNIFKKIQVSDRTQAALFAVRSGLVGI